MGKSIWNVPSGAWGTDGRTRVVVFPWRPVSALATLTRFLGQFGSSDEQLAACSAFVVHR